MSLEYRVRVERLVLLLGSKRAVSRALGVGNGTLDNRLANPQAIRREAYLALEAVETRLSRGRR